MQTIKRFNDGGNVIQAVEFDKFKSTVSDYEYNGDKIMNVTDNIYYFDNGRFENKYTNFTYDDKGRIIEIDSDIMNNTYIYDLDEMVNIPGVGELKATSKNINHLKQSENRDNVTYFFDNIDFEYKFKEGDKPIKLDTIRMVKEPDGSICYVGLYDNKEVCSAGYNSGGEIDYQEYSIIENDQVTYNVDRRYSISSPEKEPDDYYETILIYEPTEVSFTDIYCCNIYGKKYFVHEEERVLLDAYDSIDVIDEENRTVTIVNVFYKISADEAQVENDRVVSKKIRYDDKGNILEEYREDKYDTSSCNHIFRYNEDGLLMYEYIVITRDKIDIDEDNNSLKTEQEVYTNYYSLYQYNKEGNISKNIVYSINMMDKSYYTKNEIEEHEKKYNTNMYVGKMEHHINENGYETYYSYTYDTSKIYEEAKALYEEIVSEEDKKIMDIKF